MATLDYTEVEYVGSSSPIPDKTIVKVRLNLRQGYCDRLDDGTPLGFSATKSQTGSVYLECEYTVVEGEYYNRKIFDIIGIYSPNKDNAWGNMGRSIIKGILSSARRVLPKDKSPQAQKAFTINGYGDLDGLELLVEVKVEEQDGYDPRNRINNIITPNHKDYERLMGSTHNAYHTAQPPYHERLEDDEIPF